MAAQDGTLHSPIGGDGAHRIAKRIRSEGPTVVLKRPSLSKKFAYKPSFIAAVRVNVSDLTPLLNKGKRIIRRKREK